jgi:hypothetical protein
MPGEKELSRFYDRYITVRPSAQAKMIDDHQVNRRPLAKRALVADTVGSVNLLGTTGGRSL